jgi:hypothetical protein
MFWVCLKVWKQPLSHPELIIRFKSSVSQMAIWEHIQFSSTLCAVILSDTGSCRYACWCITLFWKHMLYCYVGTFRCFDTIIEQHEQVSVRLCRWSNCWPGSLHRGMWYRFSWGPPTVRATQVTVATNSLAVCMCACIYCVCCCVFGIRHLSIYIYYI